MSAVIGFWQFPEEERAFFDFLESTGRILALPRHWVRSRQELTPVPIRKFIEQHDPVSLYFGLDQHVNGILVEQRDHQGESGYMCPGAMDSCLIDYTRPRYRKGKLCLCNLAAYWTRLDSIQSSILDKDESFVRWGKKMFAWVQKQTPEWHEYKNYRATQRVKHAIEHGTLEVAPY